MYCKLCKTISPEDKTFPTILRRKIYFQYKIRNTIIVDMRSFLALKGVSDVSKQGFKGNIIRLNLNEETVGPSSFHACFEMRCIRDVNAWRFATTMSFTPTHPLLQMSIPLYISQETRGWKWSWLSSTRPSIPLPCVGGGKIYRNRPRTEDFFKH